MPNKRWFIIALNRLVDLCKDKQSIKNSNGSDKKIKEFRCSAVAKKKKA